MKTQQCQLAQQKVKMVKHSQSTLQNLKYVKYVELNYEQLYYLLPLHYMCLFLNST